MSAERVEPLGGGGAAQARVVHLQRDGAAVAALSGEIDISNVSEVREAMMEVPDLGTGLVVDLSRVEFMDSSAISLLHELAERVRRRRERMIIVCPPEVPSRRMLELSGVGKRAVLLDRVTDAVARLGAPQTDPD